MHTVVTHCGYSGNNSVMCNPYTLCSLHPLQRSLDCTQCAWSAQCLIDVHHTVTQVRKQSQPLPIPYDRVIICLQCVQAAQITFEDYFMADLHIEPLKIVGYEGVFGSLAMILVLLPLVSLVKGHDGDGLHEDSLDTLHVSTCID